MYPMWESLYLNCWLLGTVFVAMGTGAKELSRQSLIRRGWGTAREAEEDIKIKKQSSCCKTRLNPHTDGSES